MTAAATSSPATLAPPANSTHAAASATARRMAAHSTNNRTTKLVTRHPPGLRFAPTHLSPPPHLPPPAPLGPGGCALGPVLCWHIPRVALHLTRPASAPRGTLQRRRRPRAADCCCASLSRLAPPAPWFVASCALSRCAATLPSGAVRVLRCGLCGLRLPAAGGGARPCRCACHPPAPPAWWAVAGNTAQRWHAGCPPAARRTLLSLSFPLSPWVAGCGGRGVYGHCWAQRWALPWRIRRPQQW